MPIFAVSSKKGALVILAISVVSGPNVTTIVHNIENFILFNLLKSELRYWNTFWNGSATKEIGPRKTPIFSTLIGYHGNVPRGIKKGPDRSYSNKYLSFGAKFAKIGPVDLR